MRRTFVLFALLLLLPWNFGCENSTDRIDGGGVILRVTDFGTLPLVESLSTIGLLQIDSITLSNQPRDPDAVTSSLMDVQLESYEVTYTRGDTGTVVPRPLIDRIFGAVPINGTDTLNNLNMLRLDQVNSQPFTGLALDGRDDQTGSAAITLNIHLRFFGKTLSGKNVVSNTSSFTIEVVP